MWHRTRLYIVPERIFCRPLLGVVWRVLCYGVGEPRPLCIGYDAVGVLMLSTSSVMTCRTEAHSHVMHTAKRCMGGTNLPVRRHRHVYPDAVKAGLIHYVVERTKHLRNNVATPRYGSIVICALSQGVMVQHLLIVLSWTRLQDEGSAITVTAMQ